MQTKSISIAMACCALFASAATLRAQDYGARAKVHAPVASTHTEDPSASGTAIDVRDRSAALEGLHEVVATVPGARVRDSGGFGAFSAVSLRGAGHEHTTVMFDALPLNTADTGPFDLSLVPLEALDSVEVYRGGAPVWWSDGAIGGVVRLVPRRAEQRVVAAQTGYGSFGRFDLGVSSAVVDEGAARPAFFAHVDVAHADNDYAYLDDNGTTFTSDDDTTRHQRNADIDAANGFMHGGVDTLGGRLDVVLLAHERSAGVPGPLAADTRSVRRSLARGLLATSWTRERLRSDGERDYRVQVLASGMLQRHRLTDLYSELGIARYTATDDASSRAYGRVATSLAVMPFLEPTLIASVARDDYRPEDGLAFSAPPRPSGRTSVALAGELRLHGRVGRTRLELRPSVRAQWSETAIWVESTPNALQEQDRVEPTYRLAALVAPWRAVALSASAATGVRLPSIMELFGDRALQLPNTDLRPERSKSVDASVVVRGQHGALRGQAELRGFALFIDDMISYRRTAQYAVRPENIDRGRIYGIELGGQGHYGRHVSLTSSATVVHTFNQFDKRLPLRPPLQLLVRPEVAVFPAPFDRIALFAEAEHTSFVYLDPANRTLLDGRTLFSVGTALQFWQSRATLRARAENLLDDAATDVLSRPLPGFNFMLSLALQEVL